MSIRPAVGTRGRAGLHLEATVEVGGITEPAQGLNPGDGQIGGDQEEGGACSPQAADQCGKVDSRHPLEETGERRGAHDHLGGNLIQGNPVCDVGRDV